MTPCPARLERLKIKILKYSFGYFKQISLGISKLGHDPMPVTS